jgi:hypothetical protein
MVSTISCTPALSFSRNRINIGEYRLLRPKVANRERAGVVNTSGGAITVALEFAFLGGAAHVALLKLFVICTNRRAPDFIAFADAYIINGEQKRRERSRLVRSTKYYRQLFDPG